MKQLMLLLFATVALFGLDDIDQKILKAAGPVPKDAYLHSTDLSVEADKLYIEMTYLQLRFFNPFDRMDELKKLVDRASAVYVQYGKRTEEEVKERNTRYLLTPDCPQEKFNNVWAVQKKRDEQRDEFLTMIAVPYTLVYEAQRRTNMYRIAAYYLLYIKEAK